MRLSLLAITGFVLLSHRAALADEAVANPGASIEQPAVAPPAVEQPAPEPAPPAAAPVSAASSRGATAGIVVLLGSLAAGAALTAYGLTIDCGTLEHGCHRRAAAPIWGGVGVAAVGSLVGLRLLQPALSRSAAVIMVQGTF